MISVVIIGCVRLYREGLAAVIRGSDGMSVSATMNVSDASIDRLREASPNVVLVDVQSAALLPLIGAIRRQLPSVKIVAFAIEENGNTLIRCAQAGVSGYVTSDASADELLAAILAVIKEDYVCAPRIAALFLKRLATNSEGEELLADHAILTARERQVVRYICDGLSNKEIARACNISEATVKTHVHHLLEKLKLNSRNEVAARAVMFDTEHPSRLLRRSI